MNFRIVTVICATLAAASVVGWHFRGSREAPTPAIEPARDRTRIADAPAAPEIRFMSSSSIVAERPKEPEPASGDAFVLPPVVGRPFVLSRSVVEACLKMPWTCTDVRAFLEHMRAEDRRESWARDVESRIARATLTRADGRYSIRALECRHSRCAIEVTSEVDSYSFDRIFHDDPEFRELMWPTAATFARESDAATGIQTLVSVQTWATKDVALADSAARR
jgi:hypothetical protein